MAEIITNQGLQLLAAHQGNETPLVIDKIILAYIGNQTPADIIEPDRGLPSAGEIVYQSPVTYSGYLSPDMVVYSLNMEESVGPFTFNTAYCVSSSNGDAAVMIITLPDTDKIATDIAQSIRGQAMIRNFVLVYSGAQAITNITVDAQAWQFSYEKATTVVYGITREATFDEAAEGAASGIFVSPYTLLKWWSTIDLTVNWDEIENIPQFGTAAFKNAGENNSNVALIGDTSIAGNTAVVVSSGSNANGYFRIWSDGFIEQWGYKTNSTTSHLITFPVAFSNSAEVNVQASVFSSNVAEVGVTSIKNSTVNIRHNASRPCIWSAKGY